VLQNHFYTAGFAVQILLTIRSTKLKISGVFIRYLAAYVGLSVLVLIGFSLFGVKSNSGVNTGILIGAVFWPCLAFGEKNGRYFTPKEKIRVIWGMIAIDFVLQLSVALPILIPAKSLPIAAFLAGITFVMILHALAIYFSVWYAGKLFAKQQEQKLAKAND
jgi:hypothetical protein